MSSVLSVEVLVRDTFPPDPTRTVTRFGTVWPGAKFKFEAPGLGVPAG